METDGFPEPFQGEAKAGPAFSQKRLQAEHDRDLDFPFSFRRQASARAASYWNSRG
jgi:hypothetical protein